MTGPPSTASDWVAAASLLISLTALVVSRYAIRKSNRNSSCATLVTLNEGFRQAWQRFLSAENTERQYEFAELMNLFEIACAIQAERSLSGNSQGLMEDYLDRTLSLLENNEDSRLRMLQMLDSQNTFIYVQRFLESRSRPRKS